MAYSTLNLALVDQIVEIRFPNELRHDIDVLFGQARTTQHSANHWVEIKKAGSIGYRLKSSVAPPTENITRYDLPAFLMEAVLTALVTDHSIGLALHAGCVLHEDQAVILAAPTGYGKSVMTSLMVELGYGYLSDELVVIGGDGPGSLEAFPRAITIRDESLVGLPDNGKIASLTGIEGFQRHFAPVPATHHQGITQIGALIFPQFVESNKLEFSALSAGEAARNLLLGNLNAKNLLAGGLPIVAKISKNVPAFQLTYGHSDQLVEVANGIIKHILDSRMSAAQSRAFCDAFSSNRQVVNQAPPVEPVPEATAGEILKATPKLNPAEGKYKLTIGMATYDDFDGVYFSVQALRLYHGHLMDDIEILVIDNNPTGRCAQDLKNLEQHCSTYRYIPFDGHSGTSIRDLIFAEAQGEFVMSMDCHVLIPAGGLDQLFRYFEANPDTRNLLQGPMLDDDLENLKTHFKPVWGRGMYGKWGVDERANDINGQPFEIEMQGLGLFLCRKDAWAWFNPDFRGFGGEEGYIHEKFRLRGDKTLCLPFLRWLHRFPRPMGIPYKPNWEDRMRNYTIGMRELGRDEGELREHFSEILGESNAKRIFNSIDRELADDFFYFQAIRCINLDERKDRRNAVDRRFRKLGIEGRVSYHSAVKTPHNHHIGCALSHRQVIEDAYMRDLDNVLVFEDDVIFHSDFQNLFPKIVGELRTVDWEIFALGCGYSNEVEEFSTSRQYLMKANKITCNHAIAYHSSMFERILDELPADIDGMTGWIDENIAIDQYIALTDFNHLLARPMLAMQPELIRTETPENADKFRDL